MNGRTARREVLVGLVVVAAIAGLLVLLALAGGGPGFLSPGGPSTSIFRDGQGIREGSPVRIAGIDAGRVIDIDLPSTRGAPGPGPDLAAGRPRQEAEAGRQDHDPAEPDRPEPGQHRLVGPVERRARPRPGRPGGRVHLLRPDPRAGRARPGRAEPPEPHDRRGPHDGRRRRPADPRDPGDAPGHGRRRPRVGRHRSGPSVEATAGHVQDLARKITAATPKIDADADRCSRLVRARPTACSPRTATTSTGPSRTSAT